MPYIADSSRRQILDALAKQASNETHMLGDEAYFLTRYLVHRLNAKGPMSYGTLIQAIAVLNSVAHEWYRQQIDPYEDGKKDLYGDCYDPSRY